MKNLVKIFSFLLLIPCVWGLKIEITQGQINPIPIAITDFTGLSEGAEIAKIVSDDLRNSGLFIPLDKSTFIQATSTFESGIRFADWRLIRAQCLVTGTAQKVDGKIQVSFRVYDVFSSKEVLALSIAAEPAKIRKIAHMIADAIYERITGETGYFDTKIVFIEEQGPVTKSKKRLVVADHDGFGAVHLTDGKNLVLTPRFSHDATKIIYLEFIEKRATAFVFDLISRTKTKLTDQPGLNIAPRFSDSGDVVYSIARNGTTQIYSMASGTKTHVKLTDHPSINTSPCYSPDGQQIVFTSDRSGAEQMYVMNKSGTDVRRISFGEGRYSQPVWSPRGDLIAFTVVRQRTFYIGVMSPDGTNERLITTGFLVEGPTWAPNGRVIMFSKKARDWSTKNFSIDLTGR